jgi:hypothetical protein
LITWARKGPGYLPRIFGTKLEYRQCGVPLAISKMHMDATPPTYAHDYKCSPNGRTWQFTMTSGKNNNCMAYAVPKYMKTTWYNDENKYVNPSQNLSVKDCVCLAGQ